MQKRKDEKINNMRKMTLLVIGIIFAIMPISEAANQELWWRQNPFIIPGLEQSREETTIIDYDLPYNPMYTVQKIEVKEAPINASKVLQVYEEGVEVNVVGTTGSSSLVVTDFGIGYADTSALSKEPPKELIGEFELTFYCGCRICNGQWTGQPTALGTALTEGKTIAVDPSVIPLGTKVEIEGYGERTAEDTGSAIIGKKIDIYLNDHERCQSKGIEYANVWIKK